jgi:signal transduction histidine kinase
MVMPFNLERPWYRRKAPAHIASLMGAAGLVLTLGTTIWLGWSEYDRSLREAEQSVETEAYFLSDHASRLFGGAEIGLQTAAALIDGQNWDDIERSQALYEQIRALRDAQPYINDVWLNDQTGRLRSTSFAFPAPFADISAFESFQAVQDRDVGLVIGGTMVGNVSHQQTFLISDRLENSDRSFRGAASVTANLRYFSDYWQQVQMREGTHIGLYRINSAGEPATLLIEYPAPDRNGDATHSGSQSTTHADGGGIPTNARNFVAARRVGDFPLSLIVSLPRSVALSEWRAWLAIYGPLAGFALTGLGLLTALALRQARLDDAARAALVKAYTDLTAQMQARELAEQKVWQMQKIQAIGQLTGGISHDFNNLLTIIIGNADMIVSETAHLPRLQQTAKMVVRAAERGAELTSRLLSFARRQPLDPRPIDVNHLLRALEPLLKQSIEQDVDLQLISRAGLWTALVDPAQLEAAIINLSINARDAMPKGGKLTIEMANTSIDDAYATDHDEVAAGQYVMIAVSDTGTGMAKDVMLRAFEPFFTTKPVGKGSGLGLSMVYGFVKQSGGHIKIYSEAGSGTTVKLYLPRSMEKKGSAPIESKRHGEALAGHERILVVEDDLDVLNFTTKVLRECGYQVIAASGAVEALAQIDNGSIIDLLFTDVILPDGVDGRKLAVLARERLPELKVLFTSGYTENAIIHQGRLDPRVHLLSKPFRKLDLALKIRRALDD